MEYVNGILIAVFLVTISWGLGVCLPELVDKRRDKRRRING